MSPYQTHTVSRELLSQNLHISPGRISPAVLMVSPVRSGSTALLRVFASAGIPSYFQMIKNTMRNLMLGQQEPWALPQTPDTTIMLKETTGPYTETEALFNPLQALLDAGYPAHLMHLVILCREPFQTWAAWKALWGGKTSIHLFLEATKTLETIRLLAIKKRIPHTCIAYSIFKDEIPETIMMSLYRRLSLNPQSTGVTGWDRDAPFGDPRSNIIFPREPEQFHMPDGLSTVISSSGFRYIPGKKNMSVFKEREMSLIVESGLTGLYKKWHAMCRKSLMPSPPVKTAEMRP